MRRLFLVSEEHGGPWDWSKGLREQELWDEHAAFMDALVEDGFVVLGGPLDEKDVLLIVSGRRGVRPRSVLRRSLDRERHADDHGRAPLDGALGGPTRGLGS